MMFERHIIVSVLALWFAACSGEPNETERDLSSSHNCVGATQSLVKIPAGEGLVGSNRGYPEEGPERMISIESFDIDATEVTNAQFGEFVDATGYVTSAEEMQPGFDVPGAAVFVPPDVTHPNWWRFVEGAHWRHPEGPESSIEGRSSDPVVQVSHRDAAAYAAWAGRELPSETQWEYAARAGDSKALLGGSPAAICAFANAASKESGLKWANEACTDPAADRTLPTGMLGANDFGVKDMIGNVAEWTQDCNTLNLRDAPTDGSADSRGSCNQRVVRGGSWFSGPADLRYAARLMQRRGDSNDFTGFRVVRKAGP